jgi:osmotically-inducible protein OsmY
MESQLFSYYKNYIVMPKNENDWNKNRRGSNQDWDNNNQRRNPNDNYSSNYGVRGSGSSYENQANFRDPGNDNSQRSSSYGGYRGGTDYNEMYRSDNDYSGNRGMYGNSTGVNRGTGSYMGRNENDWGRSGDRGFPDSDYGNTSGRYSNDRDGNNERGWWDKTKDEVSSWFGDDDAERRRRMDEIRSHRGKGPKGYTRSDDRIKEDVNERLSDDPHIDASEIEVSVENGEVTLTGTVDSRSAKRRAEDIVEALSGVKNVENRLRVSMNTGTSGMSDTSSDTTYNSGGTKSAGRFETGIR